MSETDQFSRSLIFFVNGKKVVDKDPDPSQTLLSYLRNKLRLCGTKLGCGEGGCGACTVMVSRLDRTKARVEHLSVNACLAPVVSVHGQAVTTVEGIGQAKVRLHAVQQRLAESHGSQCGFCTPGIVMSMYSLLRNNPRPAMEDVETYFQGNLCRCTGYRPILEGFKTLTDGWAAGGSKSGGCRAEDCCKNRKDAGEEEGESYTNILYNSDQFIPYDASQEPIFPPELQLDAALDSQFLLFESPRLKWFRPTTLSQMFDLKQKYPEAKIVVGNTELGVEVKFKHCDYPVYVSPSLVREMTAVLIETDGVKLGAAVSLDQLDSLCTKLETTHQPWQLRVFKQIKEMLRWFAGKQIRNVAGIGGNIMTGSPISDLNPIFLASSCKLQIGSCNGISEIQFDENFYTGYRRNVVKQNEILVSIKIPFTKQNQYFVAYKQSKRRDDDIAIVNSAFNMTISNNRVENVIMAFGGMAPTTKLALATCKMLKGEMFSRSLVDAACTTLLEEFSLPPDVPGAMVRYRQSLVISFFFKFFLTVLKELDGGINVLENSATAVFEKEPISSNQLYEKKSAAGQTELVGRPVKHRGAENQVTGSAVYVDDLPRLETELYLGLVLSTKAHAKILRVDVSQALELEGVEDWVDHKSISKERNVFNTAIFRDELVFAEEEVFCVGMIIGGVVARDQETAQRAARLVRVEYQDLPAIVTMEEAIAAQSYHHWDQNTITKGDVDSVFSCADNLVVEGSMRTGAQEHFYLETQATIAIPSGEDGEMKIIASTQNPTLTQLTIASVLGVQANKVVVTVKRMGGGFGGKESRSVPLSAVVAVAAAQTGRPVRIMLDRDEDMAISGWRHPFLGRYKVAFNSAGKVLAADVDLYNNAGWTMDLSFSVMERAMFHSDNSYLVPNLRVRGHCCKTNLPSNTAFRGFGGPQGMMIVEDWIEKIALRLSLEPEDVRRRNLYQEGMLTHFNQKLVNCTLEKCWLETERLSNFSQMKLEVAEFNQKNRWKKRGLAMIPVKFGIAFTAVHLNQNGALVNVYTDGSVLLTHGGTEMGQGLHTKMVQVAAQTLNITADLIHVMETSTDKVPNTPPTAASAGSDLNGMAVYEACRVINNRLEKYKKLSPAGCWQDWVKAAFFDRVSLSSAGFHATPDIGYDFNTNTGNAFNYFTYGVGSSMVEIDCLTGDHQVLKTDIVMDLGESLNPGIDIGQIEGGFMQGYGLFVMEQLIHSPAGSLLTKGPGAYKIPSFNDVPSEFNVCLLRGVTNPRAVYSSKAVGEPPLFLAASVFYAIKAAIRSARVEGEAPADFQLDSPATAERIRLGCEDQFVRLVPSLPQEGTYRPWGIQV